MSDSRIRDPTRNGIRIILQLNGSSNASSTRNPAGWRRQTRSRCNSYPPQLRNSARLRASASSSRRNQNPIRLFRFPKIHLLFSVSPVDYTWRRRSEPWICATSTFLERVNRFFEIVDGFGFRLLEHPYSFAKIGFFLTRCYYWRNILIELGRFS